jgi:cytochrome P450
LGPIFRLDMMGTPLVVVSGASMVEEICDETRFDKAVRGSLRRIRAVAGDGLFTADTQEPNWDKAHHILLPTFAQRAISGYLPLMYDIGQQLCNKWERLNAEDEIDVVHDMTALALDTIGVCGFDYRFNSFYRRDYHPFIDALTRTLGDLHGPARSTVREGCFAKAARPAQGRRRLHVEAGRRHCARAPAGRRRAGAKGSAELHAGRCRQADRREPFG